MQTSNGGILLFQGPLHVFGLHTWESKNPFHRLTFLMCCEHADGSEKMDSYLIWIKYERPLKQVFWLRVQLKNEIQSLGVMMENIFSNFPPLLHNPAPNFDPDFTYCWWNIVNGGNLSHVTKTGFQQNSCKRRHHTSFSHSAISTHWTHYFPPEVCSSAGPSVYVHQPRAGSESWGWRPG